ncbi:MAG TPA: A24 family peptidase [Bacillales bacterium]|nr:A24 family peptidase [Bacillales bacterium]
MWSNVLLIILLIICVFTDLQKRKIYNSVLFPFLLTSFVLHTVMDGLSGLSGALIGTAVGFGILLIPYLLGGMGAGDVKLLAVIGALKGMTFVLWAALNMALAGGIMALLIILFQKGMKKRLFHALTFLHGLRHGIRLPLMAENGALKTTYPYGIAIAAGAIYQIARSGGFSI